MESKHHNELLERIAFNVLQGRAQAEDEGVDEGLAGQPAVMELVEQALAEKLSAKEIVLTGLTGAMTRVGEKFESGEYLIPDMLASAECVGAAMDTLSPHLLRDGVRSKGKFVLASVAGDHHDIGKNIVAILLRGAGYEVVDMGTNVATDQIVEAVRAQEARFLGLSALLTTTMMEMGEVVRRLEAESLRDQVKVLIGGAPTSREFADKIGADFHCRDGFAAIDVLKEFS